MTAGIVEIGYVASAAAFLALSVLTAFSGVRPGLRCMLLLVAGTNIAWALAIASLTLVTFPSWLLLLAEVARIASWLVFTVVLLGLLQQNAAELRLLKVLALAVPALVAVYILLQPALVVATAIEWLPSGGALWLMFPIAGLLLLENLYRNADEDTQWATKHLCIGIGVIYAYDFFYSAEAVLFGRADPTLYAGRGFVSAMMVPLIAVGVLRARTWPVSIQLSRQVVFHSFVLVGSGLYLLTIASAGLYMRRWGGDWGTVVQIIFLIGAVAMLIVIFASNALRARIRLYISRNFFAQKYDYREVWLNFVQTLSSGDPGASLQRRLLDAVSGLMESTAAGLWVRGADGAFVPVADWNLGQDLPVEPEGSQFADWLGRRQDVIALAEATDAHRYPGLCIPDWLRTLRRAWLVVPLIHRGRLQGFIVLGESRSERHLDWEDVELLQAIGRQAASYVAEEQSVNALADARQIEAFSRRFAFVAHDLKNIVGQLSLLLRNAERFKDNPEFRDDMLETVSHSIDRMSGMLEQLNSISQQAPAADGEDVRVDVLLEEIAAAWRGARANFSTELAPLPGSLRVPRDRFRSVVEHLMQNAFDAAGADGQVALRAGSGPEGVVIEVEDDGPGMEPEFVRHHLFRPFNSTRTNGFGLGAFQVREHVQSLGGRLDVRSTPGLGTTMQVRLPLTAPQPGAAQPDAVLARRSEEVGS